MIEPKELNNSEFILEKGKRYKAEISFLIGDDDINSNAVLETVAKAIVHLGGFRTEIKDYKETEWQ